MTVVDASRLTDALFKSYFSWREECAGVQSAYERWRDGGSTAGADAFAVYRAALDREERAAQVLDDRHRRMSVEATAAVT